MIPPRRGVGFMAVGAACALGVDYLERHRVYDATGMPDAELLALVTVVLAFAVGIHGLLWSELRADSPTRAFRWLYAFLLGCAAMLVALLVTGAVRALGR